MLTILRAVSVTTPGSSPADQLDWETIEAGLPPPKGSSAHTVGYTRRSVIMEEQSLKIQRNEITRHAGHRGWQIARFYEDDAISGRSHNRPALRQLQRDIKAKHVDVVIVDRIDRLYRNLLGLLRFVQLLNQYDVLLVSVSEGIDFNSHWGKLVLYVLGGLAEIYIDKLSAETKKGKRQRAKDGLDNASFRFGYCNGLCSQCTDPKGFDTCPFFGGPNRGNGKVKIPQPVEGIAVHVIFMLYDLFDFSYADVADYLNHHAFHREGDYLACLHRGHPIGRLKVPFEDLLALDGEDLSGILEGETLQFRTKGVPGLHEPDAFDADAIRTIITNRFYTGQTTYAGSNPDGSKLRKPVELFDGKHKRLVSPTRFERCQRKRKQRRTRPQNRRRPNSISPCSGLLHCAAHRKRTFRVLPSGNYKYYESKLCFTKEDPDERHRTIIPAHQIEQAVMGFAGRLQLTGALIDRISAYLVDDDGLDGILVKRHQVYERMRRAQELYVAKANPLSQEGYNRIMNECERELDRLQLDRIPQCAAALPYLKDFSKLLDKATWAEQNRLLRHILAAVYIDPGTGQPVEFKVYPPFKPHLPDTVPSQEQV